MAHERISYRIAREDIQMRVGTPIRVSVKYDAKDGHGLNNSDRA